MLSNVSRCLRPKPSLSLSLWLSVFRSRIVPHPSRSLLLQQHTHTPQQHTHTPQQHTTPQQRRTMMAGHNKWSKIRHKKGANDRKKATVLGKASKAITVASRDCKGDRSDFRLQTAVQHAKSVQLPRDRIEEAIEKGTGRSSGSDTSSGGGGGGGEKFETLRFDAMMRLEDNQSRSFGGEQDSSSSSSSSSVQVACVVTALSDNRNRTTQHVRHLVTKFGGEFLPTDHLNYLFDHVGHVLVELDDNYNKDGDSNNNDGDNDDDDDDNNDDLEALEEALMECALEAGATNIEPADEYEYDNDNDEDDLDLDEPCESGEISSATGISATRFVVTTDDKDLWKVVSALRGEHENDNGNGNGNDNDSNDNASGSPRRWKLLRFEHKYVPKEDFGEAASVIVHPDSPARERLEEFLDHLDDNEDVHKVYHNAVDPV